MVKVNSNNTHYYWFRFIPESPRWLLAMGKVKETKEVLLKASKINNIPLPENIDKILNQVSDKNTFIVREL